MLRDGGFSRVFGPEILSGAVRFRLWAPNQQSVSLVLEDRGATPMSRMGDGWFEVTRADAGVGSHYGFALADGVQVPDPASRFQPQDVHGPSEVIDPRGFQWSDDGWRGRAWEEAVIYELHIGSFTAEGTCAAAASRLDYLRDLGVTAIELMPVADFPGKRNWGYDGVLLFAPDSTYGRPENLKFLIDQAHARGIMVFLDVVYNHFGPDGNYLPAYAPIFTENHKTPWGAAVNYDAQGSAVVREFVVQNAIYWVEEFHLDGLRLDAVHAIKDDSHIHVLDEIAIRVRKAAGRKVHLLLENEENEASPLQRDASGQPLYYTAQWNDDIHHALHTAATRETTGYYADYAGDTAKLGRALAEGFAFQGDIMAYRGSPRGEPSDHLPPSAFVSFIQNHDQVGNRAFGDRLTSFAPVEAVRAVASVYLLAPQIPMIFMGEEFGAAQPFPFFCDFEAELAEAIKTGRRAEFAKFPEFHDPHKRELIPDPTSGETFRRSKLDWDCLRANIHAGWLRLYSDLLDIRRREIIPLLSKLGPHAGMYKVLGPGSVAVTWTTGDGAQLRLLANLGTDVVSRSDLPRGRRIWPCAVNAADTLRPWEVVWTVEADGGC